MYSTGSVATTLGTIVNILNRHVMTLLNVKYFNHLYILLGLYAYISLIKCQFATD